MVKDQFEFECHIHDFKWIQRNIQSILGKIELLKYVATNRQNPRLLVLFLPKAFLVHNLALLVIICYYISIV